MIAGERLVREQAEQRPNALAARPVVVESEVVAHHLVERVRALVLDALDDAQDLCLCVGDEQVEVR